MSDKARRPSVTVSGLPGSGTTTLCRLLQHRLDIEYVYAGKIFRDAAEQRGLSLAEFGALCQDDPRVDKALDDRQKELLRGDPLILEGRLAGWHAHKEDVAAVKVWLECRLEERLRRIVERDGGDLVTQVQVTAARERSEADRYRRFYDIDLSDMSPYDLVLDSTETAPDALADQVVAALEARTV